MTAPTTPRVEAGEQLVAAVPSLSVDRDATRGPDGDAGLGPLR